MAILIFKILALSSTLYTRKVFGVGWLRQVTQHSVCPVKGIHNDFTYPLVVGQVAEDLSCPVQLKPNTLKPYNQVQLCQQHSAYLHAMSYHPHES